MPYEDTDVQVDRDDLEKEQNSQRISRVRCMKVTIKVDGHVNSVRCRISLPPQVQIVHIYFKRLNWMGRYLRCTEICFATAYNPDAQEVWILRAITIILTVRYVKVSQHVIDMVITADFYLQVT